MQLSKETCDNTCPRHSHAPVAWSRRIQASGRAIAMSVAFAIGGMGSFATWAEQALVNINLDSPEAMSEGLTGVGVAKAYRIVEYREAHGPFEAVEELAEVSGIGLSTVEKNRERIVLE